MLPSLLPPNLKKRPGFSIAGFFHSYYMTTMAPAICALFGIGVVVMWQDYQQRSWRGWLLPLEHTVPFHEVAEPDLRSLDSAFSSLTPIGEGRQRE